MFLENNILMNLNKKNSLNNTLFVLLPEEIILYIINFNVRSAMNVLNKHMKPYSDLSIKNKVEFIRDMIEFAGYQSNLGFGMYNYSLFYKNRIMKPKEALKVLNLCKCCKRHQINKPKKFEKWIETEMNLKEWDSITMGCMCKCTCRHHARFICRSCD